MENLTTTNDQQIAEKIYLIRGIKVMLDKDLAEMYGTIPIRLRQQVKRNTERFPEHFMFQLMVQEAGAMVSQNVIPSAWKNEAYEQLEGQIASAKISLARLSSPQLYYVLSGNDFSLDINNPKAPKVVCLANNTQKSQVYGAVLSLYVNRINKLVNRKQQQKCSLIFDEFPTIYFNGIDNLIATARSNKVAVTLAVQDYSQLKKDYGREQAEVIMNIVGNIIYGQVTGDTAKQLSERFGKINQQKRACPSIAMIPRSAVLHNWTMPFPLQKLQVCPPVNLSVWSMMIRPTRST